jgi:hypothetical protein
VGLTAVLEDEAGQPLDRVEDPTNVLHLLLPAPDDGRFALVGAIDWYGDTVFNHLQAPRFLDEWRILAARATSPSESALMRAIERMAEMVTKERHLYLKFYGD